MTSKERMLKELWYKDDINYVKNKEDIDLSL